MSKAVIGIVAVAAIIATPTLAADMAVKAPLAAGWSWTGFYAGGNVGGGWSTVTTSNLVTATFCRFGIAGCPAAGPILAAAVPPQFGYSENGFIGGLQGGYNLQIKRYVLGIEADLSGTSITGFGSATGTRPLLGATTITATTNGSQKLDAFGTLRARLGVTPVDRLLVYATGGFAYGYASTTASFSEAVGGPCFCGPNPMTTSTASRFLPGWAIGGGLEWMLLQRWSVKGEYLYYDLGSLSVAPPQLLQLNGAGTPFFGANISSITPFKGSIMRLGLNYRF